MQIYEGWRNDLFPPEKLKDIINKVSEERLAICNSCPEHSSNKKEYKTVRFDEHCTNCGCTLSAKTKSFSSECPLKKWKAVMTEEQELEIKKQNG
jgi:hypothetical protein